MYAPFLLHKESTKCYYRHSHGHCHTSRLTAAHGAVADGAVVHRNGIVGGCVVRRAAGGGDGHAGGIHARSYLWTRRLRCLLESVWGNTEGTEGVAT